MPRPKEFDPDEALDRALELFWERGYEATSMQALVERMGINRGSLYDTFGSKEALYQLALARYCQGALDRLLTLLEAPSEPRAALRGALEQVITWNLGDGRRRGCFLASSAVELAPRCEQTSERVSGALERLEQGFRAFVERHALAAGNTPQAVARFLVNTLQGLNALARAGAPREVLEDVVQVTLSAVVPPARRLKAGR